MTTTQPTTGDAPDALTLGGVLKARMNEKGLSGRALGREADVDQSTIVRILNHQITDPGVRTLQALARALDTTVDALVNDEAPDNGATPPAATINALPFHVITRSKANPRTTFDPASLAELADTIADQGLLQPLVVRPLARKAKANGENGFELVIGERRHRAIGSLIADKRWPEARTVPVIVREVDDAEALELALIENVQRDDLTALEEGVGYRQLITLDPERFTTARIAADIGRTVRHVQQRLALNRLDPEVKTALEGGKISTTDARVLVSFPPDDQRRAAKGIAAGDWGWRTADDVRATLLRGKPLVSAALFDRESYTGAVIADDDGDRFGDVAQFEKLQAAAIKARVVELEKEYAFVTLVDRRKDQYFYPGDWKRSKAKGKAGVVIEINLDLTVTEHVGLIERPDATPAPGAAGAAKATRPARLYTIPHIEAAQRRKTAALQDAVVRSPKAAIRLAVLAMIGAANAVRLGTRSIDSEERTLAAAVAKVHAEHRAAFGKAIEPERESERPTLRLRTAWDDERAADTVTVWTALWAMPDKAVAALFRALVAGQVGAWTNHDAEPGDNPFTVALASDLELDMADHFTVDDDWLGTCRKGQLLALAEAGQVEIAAQGKAGESTATGRRSTVKLASLTAARLKPAILAAAKAGKLKRHVPDEVKIVAGKHAAIPHRLD